MNTNQRYLFVLNPGGGLGPPSLAFMALEGADPGEVEVPERVIASRRATQEKIERIGSKARLFTSLRQVTRRYLPRRALKVGAAA